MTSMQEVLSAMPDSGNWINQEDLAAAMHVSLSVLSVLLGKLVVRHQVEKDVMVKGKNWHKINIYRKVTKHATI